MNSKNLRTLWLPCFKSVGIPYIDDNGVTEVFQNKEDADKWLLRHGKSAVVKEKRLDKAELFSACYAYGTSKIILHWDVTDNEIVLSESDREIKPGYYNGRANFNILKFKETREARYLFDFWNCEFIVAARVKAETQISYAVVHKKNETDYYYVAFTTINEFYVWRQDKKWQPLKVKFSAIADISREHGYVFNPGGLRLVVSPEQIKKIKENRE